LKTSIRLLLISALLIAGCRTAIKRPPTYKTVAVYDVKYDKLFDALEAALARYFHIAYSDRKAGVISTKYSTEKSIDGIIKVRALAVISERIDGALDVNLKVIRERYWEKWEGDHELVTQKDYLGTDERFADTILARMRRILAKSK